MHCYSMSKGYDDRGSFVKPKEVREQESLRNTALWSSLIACINI